MSERERLPDRRAAELFDFEHGGRRWTATIGRFADGRVAEIFVDAAKESPLVELAQELNVADNFGLGLRRKPVQKHEAFAVAVVSHFDEPHRVLGVRPFLRPGGRLLKLRSAAKVNLEALPLRLVERVDPAELAHDAPVAALVAAQTRTSALERLGEREQRGAAHHVAPLSAAPNGPTLRPARAWRRVSSGQPDCSARDATIAGDAYGQCRDLVRERLGRPRDDWKRERPRAPALKPPVKTDVDEAERQRAKALWFWRQRRPIAGSGAETYLRQARGYCGLIPATLAYLSARNGYEPALIAAFGLCSEPEPGLLAIDDAAVKAVQLVRLKPNGGGKSDLEPNKIIVGKGALGVPIVLAPVNDLLGLAVCEGIEDALSVHAATGLGSWASGGATRMPALADPVPTYVECVNVFGHDDDAGRRGATELGARLKARGFEVIVKFLRAGSST